MAWTKYATGFLNRAALADGIVGELTVGDTDRREQNTELFRTLDDVPPGITAGVGAIIGGLITNHAFDGIADDYGPAIFTVSAVDENWARPGGVTGGPGTPTDARVTLAYASGPLPPNPAAGGTTAGGFPGGVIRAKIAEVVNTWARGYFVIDRVTYQGPSGELTGSAGFFPGVAVEVAGVRRTPIARSVRLFRETVGGVERIATVLGAADALMNPDLRLAVLYPPGVALPSVGDTVSVRVYATAISEANPLFCHGHPVDLSAAAKRWAGQVVVAASQSATKAAIGAGLEYWLAIPAPQKVADFCAMLQGSAGFADRPDDDAARVFFPTRALGAAVAAGPVAAVGTAQLREVGTPYELDEKSVVNRVDFAVQSFRSWVQDVDPAPRPVHGLVIARFTVEGERGDTTAYGDKTVTYTVPGEIRPGTVPLLAWTKAAGDVVVDRHGRGAVGRTLVCLPPDAGGVDPRVGELVAVRARHVPVAVAGRTPTSQRVGDTVDATADDETPLTEADVPAALAIVVSRTPGAAGATLKTVDLGASVQAPVPDASGAPAAGALTVPAFTLAPSPAAPTTVARATLTNADALAAEGTTVAFEVRVQAAAPAAPDSGAEFGAGTDPAGAPPVTADAPAAAAGSTVWARAQARTGSYPAPGQASAWSAWQSVTLGTATGGASGLATPVITYAFDAGGVLTARVSDAAGYAAVRLVASAVGAATPPTAADVAANGVSDGASPFTFASPLPVVGGATLGALAEGQHVYLSAVAEDALGNQSAAGSVRALRGTAPYVPPSGGSPALAVLYEATGLQTGDFVDTILPPGTLLGVRLDADVAADFAVDLLALADPGPAGPPLDWGAAVSLAGGPVAVAAAAYYADDTLAGWTTAVPVLTWVRVQVVTGAPGLRQLQLALLHQRA